LTWFNRKGDLRDRSFENQRYRASGLNLIVAAIILWNTVYLERAISALREHGIAIESTITWPRGGTSIYFRDPDGHLLELVTPGIWDIY